MLNTRLHLVATLVPLAACASSQTIVPAGPPLHTQVSEGGSSMSFISTAMPDSAAAWAVRAVVEPISRPVAIRVLTRRGTDEKEQGVERTLLRFEVRGTGGGLEAGRTYPCLAPLDYDARPSEAKRFLLMGWRAGTNDRLAVEQPSRVAQLIHDPGTTTTAGSDALFVTAFLPIQASRAIAGQEPLEGVYLSLAETLKGASDTTVRQVTGVLSSLPEKDSPVAPTIRGGSALAWVRKNLYAEIAALPTLTPVERFRYGGLLAAWDRPRRALDYLKALPNVMKAIGLDAKKDPMSVRRPGNAQDDDSFIGRLDLFTGLDPDALFSTLWNTPLRFLTIDPRITKAPSADNQRRVLTFFSDPEPGVRKEAYARLAGWNADWDRLAQSEVYRLGSGGRGIPNEAALREYWERKLGAPAKP